MSSLALLGHYGVTLYRSLTCHRLYAALNILGLAVGIAVFLVLWLDVRFETSFDRWIPQSENTYRLDETLTFPGLAPRQSAKTTSVIAPLLKADYPQIVAWTRLVSDHETLRRGLITDSEDVRYVDPDFFEVLALPLIRGDGGRAFSDPDGVVVTEAIARKYFGTVDAVGLNLTLIEDGAPTTVRVSAVLRDLPRNTHLKLAVLKVITPRVEARYDSFQIWAAQHGSTYLRFRNSADAKAVQVDLANFIERRARGPETTKLGDHPTRRVRLHLTPLPAIHFETGITSADFQPNVDATVVISLSVVGALTLAIAVLNYINLATARAVLRAREVAVRKALGATRRALIRQFLAESLALTLLAVFAGLALTELVLPAVNAAGGSALKVDYWEPYGVVPVLGAVTLVVGLAAGLYPALVLSGYQPARVLASSRMAGGGRLGARVRDILVIIQFAAAIGFSICALVLGAQAKYVQDADRGFRHDGLILVESLGSQGLGKRQAVILEAFRQIPGVEAVSSSSREPASQLMSAVKLAVPGAPGPAPTFNVEFVGPNYFDAIGGKLVAGRGFDLSHRSDDTFSEGDEATLNSRPLNIIINETALKSLALGTPATALGRKVRINDFDATVIGVARDMRFMSPHDPVQPLFYVFNSQYFDGAIAVVRFGGVAPGEMMARLRAAWREAAPGEPFVASTADVRLGSYYVADQQRARLFVMGSALAVAIACVGLYGLASFNTARRVREIGIRKTLGASTAQVLRLLVGQFLRPVLLANLVAWPLAWLAMRGWLAGFDQRINLGPAYFLAATALTLAIAMATVAGQAFAVARAEPAKALRYE